MAQTPQALIQIDGITGTTAPVFVPIRDLDQDWRAGYQLMQAGKVANSEQDISTNLITWEMIRDLSGGAFKEFRDGQQTRYFKPSPSGTGDTWADNQTFPLPWTLRPNQPLMCGCALTLNNGAYAFKEMEEDNGALYAIDELNNRVYQYTGGAWVNDVAGLNGTYPTGILSGDLNTGQSVLYVGTNSGTARRKVAGVWVDFLDRAGLASAAQQFVLVGIASSGGSAVGYVLWYSKDATIYEKVSGGRQFAVGNPNFRAEGMLWFDNYIIVTKRDGAYRCYPDSGLVRPIMDSASKNSLNGRCLIFHNDRAYFNMDGDFWSWDGTSKFRETPAEFEGSGAIPFYKGEVVGAHSDGAHLYIWYRVPSGSSYHYYLMSKLGQIPGEGWHPIFLVTTSIAPKTGLPTGAYEPGAIFYDNAALHYSISNDNTSNGRGKTGFLNTNGETPYLGAGSYTANVAAHLGWFDGGRKSLTKFLKELRFTLRDQAGTGGGGKAKFYYRKWNDTAWTLIGESAAGTQDNTTMAIPAETGAQLGITASNYFALKAELTNTAGSPAVAWWLSDMYLLGLPSYTPTQAGQFSAWLVDLDDPRPIDRLTLRANLEAGIRQAAPVTLTYPNGAQYKVKLDAGAEQRVTRYERDEGSDGNKQHAVMEEMFLVQYREMA